MVVLAKCVKATEREAKKNILSNSTIVDCAQRCELKTESHNKRANTKTIPAAVGPQSTVTGVRLLMIGLPSIKICTTPKRIHTHERRDRKLTGGARRTFNVQDEPDCWTATT